MEHFNMVNRSRRIRVYVAGAYSDSNVLGVLKNTGRGEEVAANLFQLGFAPFCPWHDKAYVISHWREPFEVSQFYEYSMAWLEVSDCVLVVPNAEGLRNFEDSVGTIKELEEAQAKNIPVFYSVDELISFYKLHKRL